MRADWAAPALGPAAAFRLAVAARQDLWRRLRRSRGLAPIVVARVAGGRATLDLWAGALDFAPAAPQAVDALSDLFQEDRLRGWTAWAARAKPAHAER
jgi:hypothetical protein